MSVLDVLLRRRPVRDLPGDQWFQPLERLAWVKPPAATAAQSETSASSPPAVRVNLSQRPPRIPFEGKTYPLSNVGWDQYEKLTERQFEAVVLRFAYGMPEAVAARYLGISRKAVSDRVKSATQSMGMEAAQSRHRRRMAAAGVHE